MADKSKLVVLCPVCSTPIKINPKDEILWAVLPNMLCWYCQQISRISPELKRFIYEYNKRSDNEKRGDNIE